MYLSPSFRHHNMKSLNDFKALRHDLIKAGADFQISASKSSAIIKADGQSYMFYFTDTTSKVDLALIKKVLADAESYLDANEIGLVDQKKISWSSCFDERMGELLDRKNFQNVWVAQTDIRAAYWTYAVNSGIISKQTHAYLVEKHLPKSDEVTQMQFLLATGNTNDIEYNVKLQNKISKQVAEFKQNRLRALGTLASNRNIQIYRNNGRGISVLDIEASLSATDLHRKKKARTRNLYFYICSQVSNLMNQLADETGALHYYWDCFFHIINPNKEYDSISRYAEISEKKNDKGEIIQNAKAVFYDWSGSHLHSLHELSQKIVSSGFDCSIDLGHITEFSIEDNYFVFDNQIKNLNFLKDQRTQNDLMYFDVQKTKRYPFDRKQLFEE